MIVRVKGADLQNCDSAGDVRQPDGGAVMGHFSNIILKATVRTVHMAAGPHR